MKNYIGFLFAIFFIFCSFTMVKPSTASALKLNKFEGTVKDSLVLAPISIVDSLAIDNEYELVIDQTKASYYHDKFIGKKTASGELFDNESYTAAHKTLPFGTKVKVTNVNNKRSVILTITDRGPYVKGRGIDLSKKAFFELTDNRSKGTLEVKIEKILDEQG